MGDVANVILANRAARRQNDLRKKQQIQGIFDRITVAMEKKKQRDREDKKRQQEILTNIYGRAAAAGADLPENLPGLNPEASKALRSAAQGVQSARAAQFKQEQDLLSQRQEFQGQEAEKDRAVRREGLAETIRSNVAGEKLRLAALAQQGDQAAKDRALKVTLAERGWNQSMAELDKRLNAQLQRDMMQAWQQSQGRKEDFRNAMDLLREKYSKIKELEQAKALVSSPDILGLATPSTRLSAAMKLIENGSDPFSVGGQIDQETMVNAMMALQSEFDRVGAVIKARDPELYERARKAIESLRGESE